MIKWLNEGIPKSRDNPFVFIAAVIVQIFLRLILCFAIAGLTLKVVAILGGYEIEVVMK